MGKNLPEARKNWFCNHMMDLTNRRQRLNMCTIKVKHAHDKHFEFERSILLTYLCIILNMMSIVDATQLSINEFNIYLSTHPNGD